MKWGALLVTIARALASLVAYLQTKRLLTAGEAVAILEILKEQAFVITQAEEARAAAHTANNLIPKSDSLYNDGFRRD